MFQPFSAWLEGILYEQYKGSSLPNKTGIARKTSETLYMRTCWARTEKNHFQ